MKIKNKILPEPSGHSIDPTPYSFLSTLTIMDNGYVCVSAVYICLIINVFVIYLSNPSLTAVAEAAMHCNEFSFSTLASSDA